MGEKTWTTDKIIKEIQTVIDFYKMNRMPSRTEIEDFYRNSKLTNAIRKHGGHRHFASMMGIQMKYSETEFGILQEERVS